MFDHTSKKGQFAQARLNRCNLIPLLKFNTCPYVCNCQMFNIDFSDTCKQIGQKLLTVSFSGSFNLQLKWIKGSSVLNLKFSQGFNDGIKKHLLREARNKQTTI